MRVIARYFSFSIMHRSATGIISLARLRAATHYFTAPTPSSRLSPEGEFPLTMPARCILQAVFQTTAGTISFRTHFPAGLWQLYRFLYSSRARLPHFTNNIAASHTLLSAHYKWYSDLISFTFLILGMPLFKVGSSFLFIYHSRFRCLSQEFEKIGQSFIQIYIIAPENFSIFTCLSSLSMIYIIIYYVSHSKCSYIL